MFSGEHMVDRLRDEFTFLIASRDFDQRRRVQKIVGECLDLVRESRREQQVLAARREQVQNLANARADETHVEHPVGFVKDQNLDAAEIDRPLTVVVPAGDRVSRPEYRRRVATRRSAG